MLAPAVAVPERHRPSWWYAHHTVVHWMHRQVDEWISIVCLRGCSISGSDWHIQREVLGESKALVKAMRSFRAVSAALLNHFLSSGTKTFEEIDEYLAVAQLHPTGRHWVDNVLLPTLLIHQFERAEREGDYHLKQLTMERMLKYFFLAGMFNTPVISPSTCWRCAICPRMRRGILCQVHVCVDTTRGTGMLSLATNLESRQPSGWVKEIWKA